jgi:hypothetical protein
MDWLTFMAPQRSSTMTKEIRFAQLVKASGKPQTATLWAKPRKNSPFMEAVKQNRVLTVVQPHKNAKDFGLIGFHEQPLASYFVFPKKLPINSEATVTGIKYDLLAEPQAVQSAPVKAKVVKVEEQFRIVVERIATVELTLVLKAANKEAAIKKSFAAAEKESFDIEHAEIQTRIKSASKRRHD